MVAIVEKFQTKESFQRITAKLGVVAYDPILINFSIEHNNNKFNVTIDKHEFKSFCKMFLRLDEKISKI